MRIDQYPSRLWVVITIVQLFFITACGSEKGLQDLDKEVGFRFGMWDDTTGIEDFIAVTIDEEVIVTAREQLLLPVQGRTFHIHGLVARGNGGHNLNWQWHFLPSEWILAEESVEVCDVSPLAIKALLDVMPDTLTSMQFCPLSSYVKAKVR